MEILYVRTFVQRQSFLIQIKATPIKGKEFTSSSPYYFITIFITSPDSESSMGSFLFLREG